MLANNFSTFMCFAIFELFMFVCFGSTLIYPHKEFLIPRPPRTRTQSSAGSRTRPANAGTRNPRANRAHLMHFCHRAASCLLTSTSVAFYTLHYGSISRGVTKGQEGAITWAPNHSGGAEILRGAKKSQQCHTYILQYSTFAPGRP